jgi:hypothetical protein
LIGKTFGNLVVKEREGSRNNERTWRCECSCGNISIVSTNALNSGNTKSCGCLRRELFIERTVTHGLTRTPELRKMYECWIDIKRKCYSSDRVRSASYIRKGIVLQESWVNSCEDFVEYVKSLPDFGLDKSLDRINTNGNYEEGNLRWATKKEQAHNRSMCINNTSGVTGVRFRVVGGNTYASAFWSDIDGKPKSKTFSVNIHGLLPAFKLAVDHRNLMISELNAQGAGYSKEHGL